MRRPAALPALLVALVALSCRGRAPKDEIVLAQVTSVVSLDPHLHDEEATHSTLSHFYSSLVNFGPELDIVPELAVSWDNPSDTLWRFHLRSGVVFHDGRPMEAADVVASLRRALDMKESQVRYYLEAVEDVRATDASTVEIATRHPSAALLNKLVFVAIVPRDTPKAPITAPVGTGPYRFVSGRPGESVKGERFDRFWGPRPAFRQVTMLPLPDSRARAEAVPKGLADVVSRFPEPFWDPAKAERGMRLLSREGIGVTMLGFSHRPGSPFADRRVRQAFAAAIDRKALIARGGQGLGIPVEEIVAPGVFGYSGHTSAERPRVDEARRLLAQAGHPAGLDVPLLLQDTLETVGEELTRQLAPAGIRVRSTTLPRNAFYDRWHRGEELLVLVAWAATTGDASGALDALVHSRKDGYGSFNLFGYENPELDRTIERANETLNPYQRKELLTAALDEVREDVVFLPLMARFNLYAVRDGIDWSPRRDRRVRAMDAKLAGGR